MASAKTKKKTISPRKPKKKALRSTERPRLSSEAIEVLERFAAEDRIPQWWIDSTDDPAKPD
jgi:hypothetical protein